MLATLVTLDEIIESQGTLREHWTLYKRMVKSVHHNTGRFNVTPEKLRHFENMITKLETQLLEGRIFSVRILFLLTSSLRHLSRF